MSSDTEKMLSNAMNLFFTKLSERPVVKLEGMEDYLKVPQYKALVNLEKKCSLMETEAASRVMESKIAYLKAMYELRACERRWFEEVQCGMNALEERNKFAKDVNSKMRKGDYGILQSDSVSSSSQEDVAVKISKSEATYDIPQIGNHRLHAESRPKAPTSIANPRLVDIKKRFAQIAMDSPSPAFAQPLQHKNVVRTVEITSTPKSGPLLSSKGSLDGSLVPNRAPTTPLSQATWDVPAPNFDDTINTPAKPVKLTFSSEFLPPRPLPKILQKVEEEPKGKEEKEEDEHTFELPRPSLPFATPTVPLSRPFLLSSMRNKEKKEEDEPPLSLRRPTPTPTVRPSNDDPMSSLGIMRLKRPAMSELGRKALGEIQ